MNELNQRKTLHVLDYDQGKDANYCQVEGEDHPRHFDLTSTRTKTEIPYTEFAQSLVGKTVTIERESPYISFGWGVEVAK